ncbi:MAG TPA: aldehyde dehydrogenase family protein [Solirubrobacteraceae bacterium]|nr:aldehyde dehydrogenase family protein [Solirubrobacteraceae bacterium]
MSAPAEHLNLVDGDWRASASGEWAEVQNPADLREVVARVPAMSAADAAEVFGAARRAARGWASTSPVARGRVLLQAGRLLRERRAEIAHDLTHEMGKLLGEALGEVDKSADFFEYCGGLGRAPQGELLADERAGARAWTVREPLGVVLAICPWNDPLLTPARKLGPALIAGNAVVLKPASYTPIVSLHLARALLDAGLPAGVLGTVTGSAGRLGSALSGNAEIDAISFTGSNEVGEQLERELVGANVKLQAELGGKNATVVLADADLELAATTIAAAGFAQAGQRCTATSRVICDRAIADELTERLAARARALVLGAGLDGASTLGPLVSAEQQRTVAGFVERATDSGAQLAAGGERPLRDGLEHGAFYQPTVLTSVEATSEIWTEEVFGPVLALTQVDGLDEALTRVNESPYGLAAAVFTSDLTAAMVFADRAEAGQVAVNLPTSGWDVHMPFGGFKASGSGTKEQGLEGVAWYTRTKVVAIGTG